MMGRGAEDGSDDGSMVWWEYTLGQKLGLSPVIDPSHRNKIPSESREEYDLILQKLKSPYEAEKREILGAYLSPLTK